MYQNYLAVFSCKKTEDQCRGTLSHVYVLHNWFFQPLAAQTIRSNMLCTSLLVSSPIQDKHIRKR